jgi:ParB family chromosome partitioning protein
MATKQSIRERTGAAISDDELNAILDEPNKAPRTATGQLGAFREEMLEYESKIQSLMAQLKESGQGAKKAPMYQLHKVSGRQRILTAEAKSELLESIRSNSMIEPIVVERRADGEWNILSGNNRYDCLEILGIVEANIFEIKVEAGKGDATAFYANLIKSTLTDFEKYQGLKRRMNETGMTNQEMAQESGLSKQVVSSIMAFDKLPPEALIAIASRPSCLGSKAAEIFSRMVEAGRSEQVVAAITSLSKDENLSQEKAITSAEPKADPALKNNIKPKQHKIGKLNFASVRGVEKTIRISFESELDRVMLEESINSLIENHIQKIKK